MLHPGSIAILSTTRIVYILIRKDDWKYNSDKQKIQIVFY